MTNVPGVNPVGIARSMRIVTMIVGGIVLTAAGAAGQRVIHVDASARGAADGTGWDDAFCDLHDAMAVDVAGDAVWIAAGTYKPDRSTGDRNMVFELPTGVALYGGFGGWETQREQHDWTIHETILSGDLSGDDGPRDCDEHSSCCRVHDEPGCDNAECEAILCGFTDCCEFDPSFPAWGQTCVDIARINCCNLGNWRV